MIDDVTRQVKDALDVWADWPQQSGDNKLGYGKTVGFVSGGSVSGWEDFEHRCNVNMAINVEALYEGLSPLQQSSIDHFHLSAVWSSPRVKIEDVYEKAIEIIGKGLIRRGMI